MSEDIFPDILGFKVYRENLTALDRRSIVSLGPTPLLFHAGLTWGIYQWRYPWKKYAITSYEHKVATIYAIFAILTSFNGSHIFYFITGDDPHPSDILRDGFTITVYFLIFFITTCIIEIQHSLFDEDKLRRGFTRFFLLSAMAFSSVVTCVFVGSEFFMRVCTTGIIFLVELSIFCNIKNKLMLNNEELTTLEDLHAKSKRFINRWCFFVSYSLMISLMAFNYQHILNIMIMAIAIVSILRIRSYRDMMEMRALLIEMGKIEESSF